MVDMRRHLPSFPRERHFGCETRTQPLVDLTRLRDRDSARILSGGANRSGLDMYLRRSYCPGSIMGAARVHGPYEPEPGTALIDRNHPRAP